MPLFSQWSRSDAETCSTTAGSLVATTDTPAMRLTDTPEMIEQEIRETPLGRIGTPEDVANTVLFLVSEAASYVTGQIVAPNGGKRMLV